MLIRNTHQKSMRLQLRCITLFISVFIVGSVFSAAMAQDAVGNESDNFLEAVDIDSYFDSSRLSPPVNGDNAGEDYELRVIDPEEEKSQRFVVVDKEANAKSGTAMFVSAKRAVDLGRYQAALRIYKEMLKKTPKDSHVLLGYAAVLQKTGSIDQAIAAYEKVLQVDESNIDAHINMLGLIGERYPAVALQRLTKLEAEQAEFNPALVGQMAFVLAKLGRFDGALDKYASISAREPQNPLHLLNMAIVADQASMRDVAIQYYEETLEMDTIYGAKGAIDRDQIFDRLAHLR